MQNEIATGDRFRPACVAFEVGGGEGEPVETGCACALELAANFVRARRIAERRAHRVPRGQGLQNTVSADEPGTAGDQNQTQRALLPDRPTRRYPLSPPA